MEGNLESILKNQDTDIVNAKDVKFFDIWMSL